MSATGAVLPSPVPGRWQRRTPTIEAAMPAPQAGQQVTAAAASNGAFTLFCILTFVIIGRPNDYFLFLVPLRLALVFTVLTVLATLMRPQDTTWSPFQSRETKLYLVLYAMMVIGIPFAVYRPGAFEQTITKYIVNIIYFLLFLVHVDSVAKLKRVAAILVVSGFIFTAFGLKNGQFIQGRYHVGAGMFDPNDVAFVEVSLFGYALWVLVGHFGKTLKAAALATVLMGAVLTLYTASRGGLLGLATFLAVFLLLRVHKVGKLFKIAIVIGLVAGAFLNADKINIDRLSTLSSLEEDYNMKEGGRVDNWKRGLRLLAERPLTGVGVYGFAPAVGWQRGAEGVASNRWATAHSTYIEILTETGVIGGTAYFLLILTAIRTFNRLRRTSTGVTDPDLAALPGVLLAGFCAQLVAGMFLSQAYSTFFTLAFAMSGTLNRLTSNGSTPSAIGRDSG